jgi:DNA-binding response OmpR family regulator
MKQDTLRLAAGSFILERCGMRILVIEDEKNIADFIRQGLREEGYSVDAASDGEKGYVLAESGEYDAIILDLMIPKMDGISLCKKLRQNKVNTPIIILTAKGSLDDKIAGLDSGAEDYLTKPFAFKELLARVRVLLRKSEKPIVTKLQVGDLSMDLLAHKVMMGEREIVLTSKEFSLLEYLMRNPGKVVTRTAIYENVWNIDFDTATNMIDVHINALRKKISQPDGKESIETFRGRGYGIRG